MEVVEMHGITIHIGGPGVRKRAAEELEDEPRKPVKREGDKALAKQWDHRGLKGSAKDSVRDKAYAVGARKYYEGADPASAEMKERGRLTKKKKLDDAAAKEMKEMERKSAPGKHPDYPTPKSRSKKRKLDDDDGGEWV
jgi:hypothetical protein